MSKKAAARFSAKIDGREVEIFHVRDRGADKGIVLTSGHPAYFFDTAGKRFEFDSQHYSVHPSNSGADTTITQRTLVYREGRIEEFSNVSFIHNTKTSLIWPVYSRRIPILPNDTKSLVKRGNDTVKRIGKYFWKCANMMYSVFVLSLGVIIPLTEDKRIKIYNSEIGSYRLMIIVTYLNIPSMNEGSAVFCATSPTVVNGLRGVNHNQIFATSVSPLEVFSTYWKLMDELRDFTRQKIKFELGLNQREIALCLELIKEFTSSPIMKHP